MSRKKTVFLCMALLSSFGCVTPMERYVMDHDYEPFVIPRSADGVGVIITFRDGAESLVASREECLPAASVPGANPLIRVQLESQSYELRDNDRLDLNLAKAISSEIDLKGAFKYSRVKKVKISFTNPFEDRVSEVSVKNHANTLTGACLEAIKNKKNFVINRVLGAQGISYSFVDESNAAITLDADLMKQINANAALERQYAGQTELKVDFPVFIGYRLLQPQILPGMAVTNIDLREVSLKEVKETKAR